MVPWSHKYFDFSYEPLRTYLTKQGPKIPWLSFFILELLSTNQNSQPLRRRSTGDVGAIAASTWVKIRADLKPKELEEDSSPVEFSTWWEEFTIFHSASNLLITSKREQQINLYSHLDKALQQRMKAEIWHKTPILEIDDKHYAATQAALQPSGSSSSATTPSSRQDRTWCTWLPPKGRNSQDKCTGSGPTP